MSHWLSLWQNHVCLDLLLLSTNYPSVTLLMMNNAKYKGGDIDKEEQLLEDCILQVLRKKQSNIHCLSGSVQWLFCSKTYFFKKGS